MIAMLLKTLFRVHRTLLVSTQMSLQVGSFARPQFLESRKGCLERQGVLREHPVTPHGNLTSPVCWKPQTPSRCSWIFRVQDRLVGLILRRV